MYLGRVSVNTPLLDPMGQGERSNDHQEPHCCSHREQKEEEVNSPKTIFHFRRNSSRFSHGHAATMGNTHITTSGVAGESLSEESVRRAAKLIVRADYGQYTLKDAKRLYQLCGDVVLTQETWYDESRARCGVASQRHSHVVRTRAGVYGVVRSCLHSYILHLTTGQWR